MKRWFYVIMTIVLLIIEVLIAIFVHDSIIRPFIGDVLVVILIYSLIRIIEPERIRLLPLYIFIFAVIVEVLQYFHIVDLLGLGGSRFFRVLIGGVFDWRDILCYGVGCLLLAFWELIRGRRNAKND